MKSALLILAAISLPASGAIVLTTQHADLSISYSTLSGNTNPWLITMRDEDDEIDYAGVRQGFADPERVAVEVPENARAEIPNDSRYTFLGPAGTSAYFLPQTQDPDLLYLGISTENKSSQGGWTGVGVPSAFLVRGVASGLFSSNRVTLRLASFSGPGAFFMYSTNAFGDPTVAFNTADGLSAADSRFFTPANHVHFNWAFTAPGEYTIGLRASGTLTATSQFTESDLTTFRFIVIPEPSSALLLLGGALLSTRRRAAGKNQQHNA